MVVVEETWLIGLHGIYRPSKVLLVYLGTLQGTAAAPIGSAFLHPAQSPSRPSNFPGSCGPKAPGLRPGPLRPQAATPVCTGSMGTYALVPAGLL